MVCVTHCAESVTCDSIWTDLSFLWNQCNNTKSADGITFSDQIPTVWLLLTQCLHCFSEMFKYIQRSCRYRGNNRWGTNEPSRSAPRSLLFLAHFSDDYNYIFSSPFPYLKRYVLDTSQFNKRLNIPERNCNVQLI